ncbi:MAG: indolepyruvate ferredoxin oxidoreductase subunit alpha [Candidatus Bathyarchaeota archaeon]|nr:indolepyruvate ferredoxin oxidoreductase subunit alpha [Candidatus Bathyarchaeota archaeon]
MVKLEELITSHNGKLLLSGNEAIVRGAIEGGIKVAAAYPGTPSTEIIDTLFKISKKVGIYAEYSTNEKVALELASGAAISGARALCSMKHVGLNVASDAFITLAYTGVRGGLVIVTADDPSCWSSQNEQDNRYYARLANVPMFEPSNSQEAKEMTISAFELSEKLELPILLRTTTRISHTLGPVSLNPIKKISSHEEFVRDTERFVMVPRNALVMHDKLLKKMEKGLQISEDSPYNKIIRKESKKIGIITSGNPFNYAYEANERLGLKASILKLGMSFPLPVQQILDFIKDLKKVIVVEELEPILESEVRSISSSLKQRPIIYGKLTDNFPRNREYSTKIVMSGLSESLSLKSIPENIDLTKITSNSTPSRPPVLCPGCPHRASFYILKTTLGKRFIYCTDIGCYALGIQPPLQIGDLLICMGASLGTASGVSQTLKEPAVAIVGDSTFFHASIPALLNAVYNKHRIVVLVLDNLTTAMTGFQPHPGVELTEYEGIPIEEVAKGCGVKYVKVVDPMDIDGAQKIIKNAIALDGPSVIIMRHICSIYERRQGVRHDPYKISEKDCTDCLACIKILGCPAIHIVEERVKINDVLCCGCGLCAHICPQKAINQTE